MSKLYGLKNGFRKGHRKGYQKGYQQGFEEGIKMGKEQQIEEMVAVMVAVMEASNDPFVDVPIEIMPQTQKVSKLEAVNKRLLKFIESEYFSYQTTTGKKYSVFNTVRKQFAEELKKRSYCDNVFKDGKWHRYVFVDEIDELLKEYENDR